MTLIFLLRLKSFCVDFYLDYINPTSTKTQFLKNILLIMHFIIFINQIICYISNDKIVSLLLWDIAYFIGGIRLYSTLTIILFTLFETTILWYLNVLNEKNRIDSIEILQIFRRPTRLRIFIPLQNFIRSRPEIFKIVNAYYKIMSLFLLSQGKYNSLLILSNCSYLYFYLSSILQLF